MSALGRRRSMMRAVGIFMTALVLAAAAGTVTVAAPAAASAPASANVYYVDSVNGDDSHSGAAADQAWRSLQQASDATLAPGDQLLLARGSRFTDRLTIGESGTAEAPIVVSAYGSAGNSPVIESTGTDGPRVTLEGSYISMTF